MIAAVVAAAALCVLGTTPVAARTAPAASATRADQSQPSRPSSTPERPAGGHADRRTIAPAKTDDLARRLTRTLERLADDVDGSVAYLVVDLTTGQRFARRADEPFPTASAIKIGILYELFAQADAGTVTLDEPRALPEASRVGGSGLLHHLKSPMLSLRDHAMLMILISDNSSTNVLIDTLGREAINARMRSLGTTSYQLRRRMMDAAAAARGDENVASASDLVVVMDALRSGKGLRPASHEAAVAILQEFGATSIRAGVPSGVRVAAKPGGLDGVRTEIAWIDLKGRPYLLCVMTSFLGDDEAGGKAITEISRAAFGYFSRLSRAGAEGRLLTTR